MSRFRKILPFLIPYRTAFALSFAASTAASFLDGFSFALLIPFFRVLFGESALPTDDATWLERLGSGTVGSFVASSDPRVLLVAAVAVVFFAILAKNVFGYLGSLQNARIQEGLSRDLRVALFSHILTMRPGYLENERTGQLLSRMLADAEAAKQFITQVVGSVLRDGVLVLVYLVLLVSLSWRLTLITLFLAPALVAVLRPVMSRVRARYREALEDRGELAALTGEVLSGARVVKAFGGEEYERKRFRDVTKKYFDGIIRTQRFAIMASPLSETLGAGVIVLLSVWFVMTGTPVRPELFVTFVVIVLRLLSPVKSLSQVPVRAELTLSAAERLFDILERPSDDIDQPGSVAFRGLQKCIELKNVSYEYEAGRRVLDDVSVRFPKGSVIGIVGPSGAGKSTLVDLLARFLDPTCGEVLVDGVNIQDFSTSSWRAQIGIVSQETIIFNDSVLTNIAYGEEYPDFKRAREAARAANAHQFIERLPAGYETQLGERGTKLSGGERQRLALARAIYRDPPLLILDEATSSLDSESERLIQEAFERLFQDRTVVVIAHRLSTIVGADTIVVLDRGRIIEQGSHAELVTAGGLYQRLYRSGQKTGLM